MAVVVTGGYGHCGPWIVRKLADEGKDVIIFNRSSRKLDFLEEVSSKIRYCKGDVLDVPSINRMFEEYGDEIEGIIHVAGVMGSEIFMKNPCLSTNINIMGTVNFLEAARMYGKKKFVYISSGAVYGERSDIPKESDMTAPREIYGAVKTSTELIGFQYANQFGIDFRSVRIFFAYGPGRLPSELYLLYQAIFGGLEGLGDFTLKAGRDQAIDFTYVKDVAKGVLLVYNADFPKHKVYNVSSGIYHKLPDVIELAAKYDLKPRRVEMGPGRITPRGPSLDIGRISEEFGYKADYTIEEGIKEYARWIKDNKN